MQSERSGWDVRGIHLHHSRWQVLWEELTFLNTCNRMCSKPKRAVTTTQSTGGGRVQHRWIQPSRQWYRPGIGESVYISKFVFWSNWKQCDVCLWTAQAAVPHWGATHLPARPQLLPAWPQSDGGQGGHVSQAAVHTHTVPTPLARTSSLQEAAHRLIHSSLPPPPPSVTLQTAPPTHPPHTHTRKAWGMGGGGHWVKYSQTG